MEQRRSAIKGISNPLTLSGTDTELAILEALLHYEMLPSTHLYTIGSSKSYATRTVSQLIGGNYIGVPASLIDYCRRRNVFYILELKDRGINLLKKNNRWQNTRLNDQLPHKYLRAIIKHSFDVAPQHYEGLKLISNIGLEVEVPSGTIIPDAPFFGYDFNSAKMFFSGFEADRGTEQLKERSNNHKTVTIMLRRYNEFYEGRYFNSLLGLPQCFTPIITTLPDRVFNILDIIKQECPNTSSRFLLKSIPDLGKGYTPPNAHMVAEPWLRVVNGSIQQFNVIETLQATAKERYGRQNRSTEGTTIAA